MRTLSQGQLTTDKKNFHSPNIQQKKNLMSFSNLVIRPLKFLRNPYASNITISLLTMLQGHLEYL